MSSNSRILAAWVVAALGALTAPTLASDTPTRFRVQAFNDVLSSTERSDDLYTAGLVLGVDRGAWSFTLGEFMFTDRDADLRFDETFALINLRIPRTGRWNVDATVGALQTGRGLLGQNVQNEIHELTGDAPLDMTYVGDEDVHATYGVRLGRPFEINERVTLEPRLDVFNAAGFRRHAMLGLDLTAKLRPRTSLLATVGLRDGSTEFAPLRPHLADAAPVAEIGVIYRGFLSAAWSYNRFGTKEPHLHLGGRWSWPRPADPAEGISAGGQTFYP